MLKKICVVTGATSGIGYVTARALALQGATVIIVGRNEKKCIASVKRIRSQTGSTLVEYLCVDLSDLKQVRDLAKHLKEKLSRIDVLVNNAGAYFKKRYESIDGYELNFALNHLSPFLLTSLLIDMLKKSKQGRIINVSSIAHYRGSINLDDLQSTQSFNGFAAYAQSKLAMILFTYELVRRLSNTTITVNVVDPGFVATNFGRNNGLIQFYVRRLIKRNDISAAEGAKPLIYLATSPELANTTARYFDQSKEAKSSDDSYDEGLAKKVWEISEELTGGLF